MNHPPRKRQSSFEMVARATADAEKLVHSAMTLNPGEEASFLKRVETIANNFNEQQRRELAQLFIKAADQQESKIKETLRAAAQVAASGNKSEASFDRFAGADLTGGPGAASMEDVDFGPFLQQENRAELMKKGGRRTRKRRGGYCTGADPIKKKDSDTLQRAINQNKEDICELFRIIDRLDDEREHFIGRLPQKGGLKPLSSSEWSGSSGSTNCTQACALCRVRGSGGWKGSSSKHCVNCQKGGKRRRRRKTRKRRGGVIERTNPNPRPALPPWPASPPNPILLKLNEIIDIINECHPNGCPQVQRPKSAMKRGGPPRAAGSARGGRRRRKSRKKRGGKWISVQQGDKNIVEFLNLYINQRIKFKFSDPPEWFTPATPSIAATPDWADRVFEGTLGKAFTFETSGGAESVAFSIIENGHSIFFSHGYVDGDSGLGGGAFEFFQFNQPPKSARKIPHH